MRMMPLETLQINHLQQDFRRAIEEKVLQRKLSLERLGASQSAFDD